MKEFLKEKTHLLISFIAIYLVIEIITFNWVNFSFLPNDLFIDLVIGLFLASFIFFIKSIKLSLIYLGFLFSLIIFLFLINTTMYSIYYDLFTLQQLKLIGEAADVFAFEHLSIKSIIISTIISLVYLGYIIYLAKKYKISKYSKDKLFKKSIISFLGLIIFSSFILLASFNQTSYFLQDKNVTAYKRSAFQKYGIFGYYTKELEDLVTQSIDGENIIDVKLSSPTDYYGLLQGKNVINILMESLQSFAINESLTPNLYNMTQNGLYFSNSYSENKTNVSELISIIGNYPTMNIRPDSYNYDFSYSLPLILKNERGYITSYFHDNVGTFYSRQNLMPQLGFDNIYFHDDLYPGQEIWSWNGDYTPDNETMIKMLPNFSYSDQPFYTAWATLSTHGPYNYGPENIALYEDLGYFKKIDDAKALGLWNNILEGHGLEDELRIRHYQATVMELDNAIGLLLDDLEEKGILEDTVIVMYGDHNVYYHDIHLKIFEDTLNEYYNMDMYKNFFCIYNEELTSDYLAISGRTNSRIDEFVSTFNIAPTLLDLLGYRYNENLFLGTSVFSEYNDVFYSKKTSGFFNDNLYSDNGEDIIYYKEEYTIQEYNNFVDACNLLKEKNIYINNWYLNSKTDKSTRE